MISEFFKDMVANVTSLMLAIICFFVAIAIIGVIPLGTDATARIYLTGRQRFLFVIVALAVPAFFTAVKYFSNTPKVDAPTTAEYEKRFVDARAKTVDITPESKILAEYEINDVRFIVYNANITSAKADVLVSSDDNYFQAKGGVAKALLNKAGVETERELNFYRKLTPKPGHGDVVVTSGGATLSRVIIHPAIIDLDFDRYPTVELIRRVVRRCLFCASSFGAKSIAFPVLGGGTASKHLKPWDSIQAIISEAIEYAGQYRDTVEGNINNIALYVFDTKDIVGDLDQLFRSKQLKP